MSTKLGTKIRQIRELRRLTQAELAAKAGLQPSAINHFECGRREPSLSNFVRLYKALRVHPGVLLGEGSDSIYSIYDTLTMEEIDFIHLVRDAVIAKHKREIKALKERERRP